MAGIVDDEAAGLYYQDDLYLERPDDKFSCPICLCPVQRQAHLTECCGRHFCLSCIGRLRNENKPCPMCKATPLAIFPNKERQREINQLRVRCPLSLPQLRALGGRGQADTTSSCEESRTVEDQRNFKIDEDRCIENQGGLCNTSSASETADLSKVIDEWKTEDNDVSDVTSCQTMATELAEGKREVVKEEQTNTTEDVRAEKVDRVVVCTWTGVLGQVENHVSEVHGAETLRRIKNENDVASAAQDQRGRHHYHHVYMHQGPRNVTYHYVRTPRGGYNFHYHVNHAPPFNESTAAPRTHPPNVPSSTPSQQPTVQQQRQAPGTPLQDIQPLISEFANVAVSVQAQNFGSAANSDQSVADGNGLQQAGEIHGQTITSSSMNTRSSGAGRQGMPPNQPGLASPPGSAGQSGLSNRPGLASQPASASQSGFSNQPALVSRPGLAMGELEQEQWVHPSQPMVVGQQYLFQQPPPSMFVRRSCPYHHVRGTRGHHTPHRHHHFHHHPPHGPRHGPPPPHPPPHGPPHGFPHGPVRGGPPPHMRPHHPHHGHPHHHSHGHHRCHGHHHPP